MRIFLALDLPEHVINRLAEVSEEMRASMPEEAIRWVKPESIHLTLKFLGEVKPDFIPQVREVVSPIAAQTPQMSLSIGDFGVFPRPSRPRVLWVGVQEQAGTLTTLRNRLEEAFEAHGFERERRRFTPHLTIGRVRRGAGRRDREEIKKKLAEVEVGKLASMVSSQLTLFESKLGPGGATYRVLDSFDFLGQQD